MCPFAGKGSCVPIIHVQDVTKDYRRPKRLPGPLGGVRSLFTRQYTATRALDGVSFAVDEGELLGYIGANGAGKSTTIKILTGILVPSAGQVTVAGIVPWRERERNARNVGIVFGQRSQLWWDLPLIESFKLIGRMYRVTPEMYRRNLDHFIALLDMQSFLDTPVRQLSLGQRMRGDLVAAMLYEPPILYLDEPTVGLDVLAKERIRRFIQDINRERQVTVLLTTHDLSDVELLCKRILLVHKGRILYDGSVERLKAQYAPHRTLVVRHAVGDAPITVHGAEIVQQDELRVWLRFDPEQMPVASLIAEVTAHYQVTDLSIEEPDLESVVRQIYEHGHVQS
jgi:ABC-2 type transport system ATP-binding protein